MFQNFVTVSKKRNLLFCLFLSAIAAFIWTEALLYSQNNLLKNEFWFPDRVDFSVSRVYGIESFINRNVVASNSLRVENNIYQRIFSKKKVQPSKITFDFNIRRNSYLDIVYNGDGETFEAIRISNYKFYPSYHYKAHKDGQFIWKKNINIPLSQSMTYSSTLEQSGNNILLFIDGKKTLTLKGSLKEGYLGFKVFRGAVVKDPVIELVDGTSIQAGFKPKEKTVKYFFYNFILITLILLVIAIPFRKNYFKRFITFSAFLIGTGVLWYTFDFYYYSKITMVINLRKNVTTLPIEEIKIFNYEEVRYRFFKNWYVLLGGKVPDKKTLKELNIWPRLYSRAHHCLNETCSFIESHKDLPEFQNPKNNRVRIFIAGESLSSGSGIEKISQGYVELLHRALLKHYSGKLEIETLNVSKGRLNLGEESLMRDIDNFKPHFIFMDYILLENPNLSPYEDFLRKTSKRPAEVIVMRLPIDPILLKEERMSTIMHYLSKGLNPNPKNIYILRRDPFLIKMRNQYPFTFVDPNNLLLSPNAIQNGDIWWNVGHLTAYGNKLLADYLKDHFIKLIEEKFLGNIKTDPNKATLKPKISTLPKR